MAATTSRKRKADHISGSDINVKIPKENRGLAVHNQMQSILFSGLPFDVRYLIYKEVLGSWIFRLDDSRVVGQPDILWKAKMMAWYKQGRDRVWHCVMDNVRLPRSRLLPLLKACRRMYVRCLPSLFLFLRKDLHC
jgi:hypothetical protein